MLEAKQAGKGDLKLVRDDLTLLELDAFVFYADHSLKLGSGYGGAISMRGGPSIQEELDGLGPLDACEAVVSAAGDLKAEFIIHAVGPRFREDDMEEKLRKTMRSAFAAAVSKGVKRIGFPAMGAGFYGIPLDLCAKVMVEEIRSHLDGETSVEEAVICVQDKREVGPFEKALSAS